MKKLLLLLLLPLVFSSCSDQLFDSSLLNASQSVISPRLDLKLLSDNSIEITGAGNRSWQQNAANNLEKLLIKEIRSNYISNSNQNIGFIVPKIKVQAVESGLGFGFLTGLSLGLLNLIGMPISGYTLTMYSTFEIYDNNQVLVWETKYVESEKFRYGMYHKNWGTNSVSNNSLKILKKTLSNLNNDIIVYTQASRNELKRIEKDLIIGGRDIRNINIYDLKAMVNYFVDDCKINNINLPFTDNIIIEFVELDANVIGVSSGRNDDSVINLKIDPENWAKSSLQKKWYLLYHELGHDVLNLGHGEGGKMMFNFIDRDYKWEEFINDKNYMFNYYKNN